MKKNVSVIVLALAAMFAGQTDVSASSVPHITQTVVFADNFYRTELYFGRSIPGGGVVTNEEWDKFLAEVVTTRFPDGFTILSATGQYREMNGTIDKEPSEILIILYRQKTRTSSRRKIEEIRRAYVKQFKQESVLKVDFKGIVDVTFK